jgi:cysteate synthase
VASVLSNQLPPYSIAGGIFDILRESQGDMFVVRNEEALQAMRLFERCEGIDIDPAAGVALASLIKAARSGQIDPEATVLLHITGGGSHHRDPSQVRFLARPDIEISLEELGTGADIDKACGLFADPMARPASVHIQSGT